MYFSNRKQQNKTASANESVSKSVIWQRLLALPKMAAVHEKAMCVKVKGKVIPVQAMGTLRVARG
jgi:hypothetical protein